MHDILRELVFVFGASLLVTLLFSLVRQPPIAGYLLAGVLLGKSAFGLVTDSATTQNLAEIGLVFLLFSIGLEFSPRQLFKLRRALFLGGGLQVLITTALVGLPVYWVTGALDKALLVGVLVSLSSTAISLKLLHNRHELNTPQGNLTLAVLLFQDLMAVPLLVLLPLLATVHSPGELLTLHKITSALLITLGTLVTVFVGGRYVVPAILDYVAKTRVRELFLITVAFLTFGAAWAGEAIGISIAMGAFLAGMMVAESRHGHQVLADLIPLRDPFVAVFFVSIGLLLDLNYFMAHFMLVIGLALLVFILKFVISATVASFAGYESRVSAMFAVYTSQIGEFSFVIASVALLAKLLTVDEYQLFLSVTVTMMLISPSLIRFAPNWLTHLVRFDLFRRKKQVALPGDKAALLNEHVLIVGYGMNGQNLVTILKRDKYPYAVIESNIETVKSMSKSDPNIIFGDGSRIEVLEAAGIRAARMVVVAINDIHWVAKVVASIRTLRPDVHLIVRCLYQKNVDELRQFRIDDIIIGEELTARAILTRVLLASGMNETELAEALAQVNLH